MRPIRDRRPPAPPRYRPILECLEGRTLPTTFVVDPVAGIGDFTTIQAAVNAANPAGGDTILVNPATYTEQVRIDRSLTLQGNGGTPTIQCPGPPLTPVPGAPPNPLSRRLLPSSR